MLIVDDSATNRRILTALISSWEMLPVVVSSGTEVLTLINQGNQFDVALLDFQMPEMDGLTLAQTLSHHQAADTLPLVMLSSIGERQTYGNELFAHWLTKPIKPDQLHRVLAALFGNITPAPIDQTATLPDLKNRTHVRILLAEDNAINQKVALRMLERLGYRVDVVANGTEVLNVLTQIPYDIILMDVMMPEMDGIEATRKIRSQTSMKQPNIIALTANAMEEDRGKMSERRHGRLSFKTHQTGNTGHGARSLGATAGRSIIVLSCDTKRLSKEQLLPFSLFHLNSPQPFSVITFLLISCFYS